jgi:hypothetical protein
MDKKQLLLLSSIILIFLSIIISLNQTPFYQGKLSNIEASKTRTIVQLENYDFDFVAFEKVSIENCKELKIYGKEETYKTKKQILIEKILCLN